MANVQLRDFTLRNATSRSIDYRYRYCERCRHEWPEKHCICPGCGRFLGNHPLERREWQIVPNGSCNPPVTSTDFRLVVASVVVVRAFEEVLLRSTAEVILDALRKISAAHPEISVSPVPQYGWLIWTVEGPRLGFLQSLVIERELRDALAQLASPHQSTSPFRWSIWTDQYVVPFAAEDLPWIVAPTDRAIFAFEPDGSLLCAETIYDANRAWEHFVAVPRRLLSQEEVIGYRFVAHKRPSALDQHAERTPTTRFLGRDNALHFLDECEHHRRFEFVSVAVIAKAGSGKSRLLAEWCRRHPGLRSLTGSFSLFGGDMIRFAAQLAPLPEHLTVEIIVNAILERIRREDINVLILDDLHWADSEGVIFLGRLLESLQTRRLLVVLISRPSGMAAIEGLRPMATLNLPQLSPEVMREMAFHLGGTATVAETAAQRASGNPLFVEHFSAWADETCYEGVGYAPRNLFEVIAARITYLAETRIAKLRQSIRWGFSSDQAVIETEIRDLESEIGLWLDRLESGDYGDQMEVARHFAALNHVDTTIFLISVAAGKPRTRSGRLQESIERLVSGSANELLADLKERVSSAAEQKNPGVLQQALHAGDVMARHYKWKLAADFYRLASDLAESGEANRLADRATRCRRRLAGAGYDESEIYNVCRVEVEPAVDALRLPVVWAELGLRFGLATYLRRAAQTATMISDLAMAEWATSTSLVARTSLSQSSDTGSV